MEKPKLKPPKTIINTGINKTRPLRRASSLTNRHYIHQYRIHTIPPFVPITLE